MATSKQSKNSKAKGAGPAKDRPFAPEVVAKAAGLVRQYQVIIRWSEEEECYEGRCAEMPNTIGFGADEAECLAEVRGNLNALVMHMIEAGETPPLADEPARTVQVNVRFADYEKATAQALADAAGKTLSDYIRVAALRGA